MLMKQKNASKTSTTKLGVIAFLVIALLSFGFYVRGVIENLPKDDPDPEIKQVYTVTLNDYKVYQFTDVLYDFIMANVTVTSNLAFTLDEEAYTTSENVNLINTAEYTDPLIEDGYQMNCPLPTADSELSKTYCLFIPIVNRSLNELILKVDIDRIYNLSFNMNDVLHAGTRGMLGMDEPAQEFTAVIIDKSLISTKSFYTLNNDGDHIEAAFSTNSQVFGFQITIENNSKKVFIVEDCYLTIDGKGTYQKVDPTFMNDDQIALLGVDITSMTTGYLFFDITDDALDLYSLQNSTIHLLIKLSTVDSYIEVLFLGSN